MVNGRQKDRKILPWSSELWENNCTRKISEKSAIEKNGMCDYND